MTIGEFLKKKREEAQLTQNQLSNKTGLSTSGIFRIENNDRKPSIETLEKYANFFFLNKVLLLELTGYLSKEDIKNYTMSIITTKAMNENNINDDVVKFLREEREKRKISQGQLSYKSGISVSIISKIEQGLRNPTVNTVLSIGKALGIDTMVLLEKMNVVTNEELENHIEKQVAKRLSENIEFLSEQTDKGSVKMPVICRFYGIIIKMYFNDHLPPHLHAIYGEYNGVIDLNNFEMIEGDLPTRALKLVQEWTKEYQTELLRMWESKNFIKLPELR